MKLNKLFLGICLFCFVIFTLSCSMVKDSKAAEPAVEKFHAQFNEKQFSEIYNDSGSMMKDSTTEKELVEFLSAIHRKLGAYNSSTATNWHDNSGPLTSLVTLTYDTDFSDGKGSEQFLISVKGDMVKLEGYNINSTDLILK